MATAASTSSGRWTPTLRRLGTDYLDLYLLHTWDRITPAEEVVRTFDDLVRAGKIRYAGLSDVPAWYAARAQSYAEAHALSPMITAQLPYSLVTRDIEPEFAPMAQTLGLGITAWSPLAGGVLTGKYRRGATGLSGEGRYGDPAVQGLPIGDREWAGHRCARSRGGRPRPAAWPRSRSTGSPPSPASRRW